MASNDDDADCFDDDKADNDDDDYDNNDYDNNDDDNDYFRQSGQWLAIQTPLMASCLPGFKVDKTLKLSYQRS